jgi:hypothetical protein
MIKTEDKADLSTYELRVRGHLGPLLLSAIPHEAAVRVPPRTTLITEASDQRDLVSIVRLIVAAGLELEGIRENTSNESDPCER